MAGRERQAGLSFCFAWLTFLPWGSAPRVQNDCPGLCSCSSQAASPACSAGPCSCPCWRRGIAQRCTTSLRQESSWTGVIMDGGHHGGDLKVEGHQHKGHPCAVHHPLSQFSSSNIPWKVTQNILYRILWQPYQHRPNVDHIETLSSPGYPQSSVAFPAHNSQLHPVLHLVHQKDASVYSIFSSQERISGFRPVELVLSPDRN